MKERYLVVTIDTITELFKDYCGEDIPADAKPIKLLLKPTDRGRLAILLDSDTWVGSPEPLSVSFKIKRVHTVAA